MTNTTFPALNKNYVTSLADPQETKKRGSLKDPNGAEHTVSLEEGPSKSSLERVRSFPRGLTGILAVCFLISIIIWPVGFFITGSSAMTITGIVLFSISVTGFVAFCLANYIGACVDKAQKNQIDE